MLRIGVLCSGGGTNLQAIINAINHGELPAEIGLVVSSKSGVYALERAAQNQIPGMCLRKRDYTEPGAYEEKLISLLRQRNIELVILAGFTVILDGRFHAAFPERIMNIHPALIPSFCGKGFYGIKVHEAVLEAGVKVTGATVHFVTPEVDAGPIILQEAVEVKDGDNPESLQRRVMEAEQRILPRAIKLYAEGKLEINCNKTVIRNN